MKARLFCRHCDKHYEVEVDDIRAVQAFTGKPIAYDRNTYFFTEGCFFKTLGRCKKQISAGACL